MKIGRGDSITNVVAGGIEITASVGCVYPGDCADFESGFEKYFCDLHGLLQEVEVGGGGLSFSVGGGFDGVEVGGVEGDSDGASGDGG